MSARAAIVVAGLALGALGLAVVLSRNADQGADLPADGWLPWTDTGSTAIGEAAGASEGAGGDLTSAALDMVLPVAYRMENWFFSATGQRMYTSIAGLDAIKRREKWSATPYKDQGGLWTIGYGHLLKAGEWYDSITEAKGMELLASDLGTAEDAVNSAVKVPITQAMFDALVSLVFNIGVGAFRGSTLLRKLNAGDYAGAQDQFRVWRIVTIGGVRTVSDGLVNRRGEEAAMFASAGYPGASA